MPDWNRIAESMMGARLIYFSGITLSLYSNTGLGRLLAIVEMARQQGAKIAFDGNFRPQGWKGDLPRTRTVFMEALKRVDVALPTYDDEAVLWGDPSPEATIEHLGMATPPAGFVVSKVGSASSSTRLSASMNTVRVRGRSPFQPCGRKLPSKATLAPCWRANSIAARNRPSPVLEKATLSRRRNSERAVEQCSRRFVAVGQLEQLARGALVAPIAKRRSPLLSVSIK